jgi:hypothetical protein
VLHRFEQEIPLENCPPITPCPTIDKGAWSRRSISIDEERLGAGIIVQISGRAETVNARRGEGKRGGGSSGHGSRFSGTNCIVRYKFHGGT